MRFHARSRNVECEYMIVHRLQLLVSSRVSGSILYFDRQHCDSTTEELAMLSLSVNAG